MTGTIPTELTNGRLNKRPRSRSRSPFADSHMLLLGSGKFKEVFAILDDLLDDDKSVLYRFKEHSKLSAETAKQRTADILKDLQDVSVNEAEVSSLGCRRHFMELVAVRPDGILAKPRGFPLVEYDDRLRTWRLVQRPTTKKKFDFCSSCWDEERNILTEGTLVSILNQTCVAVLCLHMRGKTHGDIKPFQFIVHCSEDAHDLIVVLADVDSVADMDGNGLVEKRNRMRTEAYTSPLRINSLRRGSSHYNGLQDDLHALRLTLFDFLFLWSQGQEVDTDLLLKILRRAISEFGTDALTKIPSNSRVRSVWLEWCNTFVMKEKDFSTLIEEAGKRFPEGRISGHSTFFAVKQG